MFKKFLNNRALDIRYDGVEYIFIDYIDDNTYKFTVRIPKQFFSNFVDKLLNYKNSDIKFDTEVSEKYLNLIPNYNSPFNFSNKIMAFTFNGLDTLTNKPKGAVCYLYMDDFIPFVDELENFVSTFEEA